MGEQKAEKSRASRADENERRARAERLRKQIAELKKGRVPPTSPRDFIHDEMNRERNKGEVGK